MKKRKIKKTPFIIVGLIIIGLIISIVCIKNYIKKINSYEYKFEKIGYNEKQINNLLKNLNEKELNKLLEHKYNKNIDKLVKEKYFIFKNLDKYIKYDKELEEDKSLTDIVAIVNVGSNKEWYSKPVKTNIKLKEKMLVNKFNNLTKDYKPDNLTFFSAEYAYGNDQSLIKDAYDAYVSMFKAAKKKNITLIINSSYRDYEDQEEVYDNYSKWYGEEEADKTAARPGYSEHQTGYTVDIQTYKSTRNTFEDSDAFKWLQKNGYKYGFILRYPKGKEYLTGYDYESWHYRYVGVKIAKYIQENNITFDEYYAYFLD